MAGRGVERHQERASLRAQQEDGSVARDGEDVVNTANDLEYYLGYKPDSDIIAEAGDWQQDNPGEGLNEWVEAMTEIGAL